MSGSSAKKARREVAQRQLEAQKGLLRKHAGSGGSRLDGMFRKSVVGLALVGGVVLGGAWFAHREIQDGSKVVPTVEGGSMAVQDTIAVNSTNINSKVGLILKEDTRKLEVIVIAVPQAETLQANYLLNGNTDDGDWCQWGLEYRKTFYLTYQLWHGITSLTPNTPIALNCNSGDKIALSMDLSEGYLTLAATNLKSGAFTNRIFASGATTFKGGLDMSVKKQTPTGIFTETWSTGPAEIADQTYSVEYPEHLSEVNLLFERLAFDRPLFNNKDAGEAKFDVVFHRYSGWTPIGELTGKQVGVEQLCMGFVDEHTFRTHGFR